MLRKHRKKAGRPSKMTPTVLRKLREMYLIGANDAQACLYAEIGQRTLYDYQRRNPSFRSEKREWQLNPSIKAQITLYNNLDQIDTAKWYLERKAPDEFGKHLRIAPQDRYRSVAELVAAVDDKQSKKHQ